MQSQQKLQHAKLVIPPVNQVSEIFKDQFNP